MQDVRKGVRTTARPVFDLDTERYAREIGAIFDRYATAEPL